MMVGHPTGQNIFTGLLKEGETQASEAASPLSWKQLVVAVGICCMQLVRNITGNPEVRVLKEKRAAGVLDNFVEGERY
ncbi:hypothetical protein LWI29_030353 [Acer saccharum]|uniref:Uncharacterized protein n=1 Tax=Acer saccharum TaxID=4024 RepID=A0AA39RLY0_ACESA|nr:hypothetical protein LWI29_030353 [Acer saccharum]